MVGFSRRLTNRLDEPSTDWFCHRLPLRVLLCQKTLERDFIDMKERVNENKVIRVLREELKKDRVPADFIDMTELGLVEITRKREEESLHTMLTDLNGANEK